MQVVEYSPTIDDMESIKFQLPLLDQLWQIVYAAVFWLAAHPSNVVVLCSSAGDHHTGIVVSGTTSRVLPALPG